MKNSLILAAVLILLFLMTGLIFNEEGGSNRYNNEFHIFHGLPKFIS